MSKYYIDGVNCCVDENLNNAEYYENLINNNALRNADNKNANIIKLISPNNIDKKLSIVCSYDNKPIKGKWYDGSGCEVEDITNVYQGLHPTYMSSDDGKSIKTMFLDDFKSGVYSNKDNFNKFLSTKSNCFSIEIPNEYCDNSKFSAKDIAKAIYAKNVLYYSLRFGYKFKLNCDTLSYEKGSYLDKLVSRLGGYFFNDNSDEIIGKGGTYKIFKSTYKNKTSIYIELYGMLEECVIDNLNDIYVVNDTLFFDNLDGVCLKAFYSDIKLTMLHDFYPGLDARVRKIEFLTEDQLSNNNIECIKLTLSRVSFIHIVCMDDEVIDDHFLLSDYRETLNYISRCEANLQSMHVFKDDKDLSEINLYLENTINSCCLVVSGNIITKDNYLLFGYRESSSIDSNTIYCSANGHCEFYDKSVSFYNESVYADLPTLRVDSERLDLIKEYSRECIAELGVIPKEDRIDFVGISVLGLNKHNVLNGYNRLHFNVLLESEIDETYDDVVCRWSYAVEKYENQNIIGIKYEKHKNHWVDVLSFFKKAIMFVYNNFGAVASLIVIVSLSKSFILINEETGNLVFNFSVDNFFDLFKNIMTVLIFGSYLITFFCKKIKYYIKFHKSKFNQKIYRYEDVNENFKKSKNIFNRYNYKMSPISILMLSVHFNWLKHKNKKTSNQITNLDF